MKNDLTQKAAELEQTLQMQLKVVKEESEGFVKFGAVVLAGATLAFAAYRIFGRKKNQKTKRVLEALEKEGLLDEEIRSKLTQKNRSGFLGRIGAALIPMAVSYGRNQLINRLNEPKTEPDKNAK
jgi:hypothetical protein